MIKQIKYHLIKGCQTATHETAVCMHNIAEWFRKAHQTYFYNNSALQMHPFTFGLQQGVARFYGLGAQGRVVIS